MVFPGAVFELDLLDGAHDCLGAANGGEDLGGHGGVEVVFLQVKFFKVGLTRYELGKDVHGLWIGPPGAIVTEIQIAHGGDLRVAEGLKELVTLLRAAQSGEPEVGDG